MIEPVWRRWRARDTATTTQDQRPIWKYSREGPPKPTRLRHVLSCQLTIAELLGIAVILGTPYLIIGLIWSCTHTEHLRQMQGADLVVSFLGLNRFLAIPAVFQRLHDLRSWCAYTQAFVNLSGAAGNRTRPAIRSDEERRFPAGIFPAATPQPLVRLFLLVRSLEQGGKAEICLR
jgi:hypothetical protein